MTDVAARAISRRFAGERTRGAAKFSAVRARRRASSSSRIAVADASATWTVCTAAAEGAMTHAADGALRQQTRLRAGLRFHEPRRSRAASRAGFAWREWERERTRERRRQRAPVDSDRAPRSRSIARPCGRSWLSTYAASDTPRRGRWLSRGDRRAPDMAAPTPARSARNLSVDATMLALTAEACLTSRAPIGRRLRSATVRRSQSDAPTDGAQSSAGTSATSRRTWSL